MNEVDELIDEVLRDVRVDTDTEEETNIPERTEANRFGTIPIHQQRSGIKTPIEQEGKKK